MKNKKLKKNFAALQAASDFQSVKCKKAINQLRSYIAQIEKHFPYADEELYKKVTRKCVYLQRFTATPAILSVLRTMQGTYHRKAIQQEREQYSDFQSGSEDSWCGVEFEY
ncbi:MAG: hypothetical protein IJ717_13610 [Treponema sp.]|nr:hypothetical protein [Treponema sp.]